MAPLMEALYRVHIERTRNIENKNFKRQPDYDVKIKKKIKKYKWHSLSNLFGHIIHPHNPSITC